MNHPTSSQPTAVLLRISTNRSGLSNLYSVITSPNHRLIHLNSSKFNIGRDKLGCQYTFDTLDVSRKHVMFEHDDDGWKITDLSSNGTWLSFDDSHTKLEKNVSTLLKNFQFITLKPSPEIRYVFIDNVFPSDISLTPSGPMTHSELLQFLSNLKPVREKRQRSDLNSDIPEKRFCSHLDEEKRKELVIEEQARLIDELTRKLNAQPKLFESANFTCSICLEIIIKPTTLVPCQHVFCHTCISEFRESVCSQRSIIFCPLCRSQPSFFFLNKSLEMTIDQFLQSSLSDQELLARKKDEQEHLLKERNISKIFKTVQSQICLPPVVLTDSNQIEELEDLENFIHTMIPDIDDSDNESDTSNIDVSINDYAHIQDLYEVLYEPEQNILVSPSF